MGVYSKFKRGLATLLVVLVAAQPVGVILADDTSQAPATTQGATGASDGQPGTPGTPADPGSTGPGSSGSSADSGSSSGTSTTPTTDSGSSSTPAPAAPTTGPSAPTGAQGTTGPSTPTGVQGSTGPTTPTGPQGPTSAAPTYAFNDAARRWEPTIASSFIWSNTAHQWTSPFYAYNSVTGWWHTIPSVTPSDAITALTSGSADPASLLNQILGIGTNAISTTGPGSSNQVAADTTSALLANLINNLSLTNGLTSDATTGNASVGGNTVAGDAISGAASVVTNLLNLLNAMWSFSSSGMAYFVDNIMGDQTGDVTINPQAAATTTGAGGQLGTAACTGGSVGAIDTTGPSSTNSDTSNCNSDVTVNSQTTGSITNNVNNTATSGNATVSGNTSAGNAISGDARAEVNIVNLINTAIGSSQSFFGIVNIYGNLNGDILFPSLGLNGAVASDSGGGSGSGGISTTGPNSDNTTSTSNTDNATVNNNVSGNFNNNINATATTGSANTSGNTTAGSATTGAASTNSSLFNLFNTNVFGDNAVLVIINDMGHWIGKIMNLNVDGGSGGGLLTSNATVTNTGPNSSNTSSSNNTNNTTVNNNVNGTITNNVNATATSGDATVTNNTKAGGATSGNATVSSDIANIFGSNLSFNHVFGILFINVYGSWTGDVGDDTAAGNQPVGIAAVIVPLGNGASALAQAVSNGLGFTGTGASGGNVGNSGSGSSNGTVGTITNGSTNLSAVNAAAKVPAAAAKAATRDTGLLILLAAATMLLAGGAAGFERRMKFRS